MNKQNQATQQKQSQEQNQPRQPQQGQLDKISVKFNFGQLQKFIKFEFQRKVSLIELRPTFSRLLEIDLFGKQLKFSTIQKDNQQPTQVDEIKALADQDLPNYEYEMNVNLLDYGA